MSDAHYHEYGYTIQRKRICEHDIVELLELLSSMDLGARKLNLLDNARLRQRIDQLIKPLFREAGITVNALVELHALAADVLCWHLKVDIFWSRPATREESRRP